MKHALLKTVVGIPLSVALYYTVTCPCDVFLECHKKQYFIALGLAVVLPLLAYPELLQK